MDIFNELKEQLSSCPERTRALCRTVWGAVSTSLSTALTAASIEAGDDRDDGGGGGGRGGGGGSAAVGGWCTTLTSTTAAAAAARGANGASAAAAGSTGGRFATIMGAVKSRSISNVDVERDDLHMQPHPQHNSTHSMMRNGHHHSAAGGGTLQKQDLRYDIGSSTQYHHVRQPSVRSRSQQPMPTTDELDRRFAKVLVSFKV